MTKFFDPKLLSEAQREQWEREKRSLRRIFIGGVIAVACALLLGGYFTLLGKPHAVEVVSYSPKEEVCVKHLGWLFDNAFVSIEQCAYPEVERGLQVTEGEQVLLEKPGRTHERRAVFLLSPLPSNSGTVQ